MEVHGLFVVIYVQKNSAMHEAHSSLLTAHCSLPFSLQPRLLLKPAYESHTSPRPTR